MLEKSSHVVLTDDDLAKYNAGIVSERIKQTWGIESLEVLSELIALNQIHNNSKSKVSNNES